MCGLFIWTLTILTSWDSFWSRVRCNVHLTNSHQFSSVKSHITRNFQQNRKVFLTGIYHMQGIDSFLLHIIQEFRWGLSLLHIICLFALHIIYLFTSLEIPIHLKAVSNLNKANAHCRETREHRCWWFKWIKFWQEFLVALEYGTPTKMLL